MDIYKITNKLNGDFYIGKTVSNLNKRWRSHIYTYEFKLKNNYKLNYLYSAFQYYGLENFEISLVESDIVDKFLLSEKEIIYISKLKPKYNITKGGDGCGIPGRKKSEEHKKKISESKKGKFWVYNPENFEELMVSSLPENYLKGRNPKIKHGGRIGDYNEKRFQKISESNKGRKTWNKGLKWSNEIKLKISNTRKSKLLNGEIIHPKGMLGKTHSEETKIKMKNSKKLTYT